MMKNTIFATSLAVATLLGASANAASITISTFSISDFNTATLNDVVEDFESYSGSWVDSTVTSVGTFATFGANQGTGLACETQAGGPCADLFVNDSEILGQGNLVPFDGTNALSSNDTDGISWEAFFADGAGVATGGLFSQIVFAVRDAADIAGTIFTIEAGGETVTLQNLSNNNEQLVVIDLGGEYANATVSMFNNQINDGFTIDGASLIAPVPVPAAGFLLLGGFGLLGAMRRRKNKAA